MKVVNFAWPRCRTRVMSERSQVTLVHASDGTDDDFGCCSAGGVVDGSPGQTPAASASPRRELQLTEAGRALLQRRSARAAGGAVQSVCRDAAEAPDDGGSSGLAASRQQPRVLLSTRGVSGWPCASSAAMFQISRAAWLCSSGCPCEYGSLTGSLCMCALSPQRGIEAGSVKEVAM